LYQQDSCIFRWGDLKIDLKKYANPNVYSGFVELKKEQVIPFLDQKIHVFKDGEALEMVDLTVRYYDKMQNDVINLELDLHGDQASIRLPQKVQMLAELLKQGDAISIYGKVGEITLNAVSIRIYNPNSLYEPKIWINNWKKPETTYGFQVISREGFKTRLRIDTNNTEVHHVLKLYQDPERYDIIHIPGFATYQRLLHSDAQSFGIEALQKYPDRDWLYRDQLPENLDYVNHLVQLRWGELFAMPNSEIYSPEEFFNNIEEPVELWFDREQKTILRIALAIIPKDGPTDYLLLDREQLPYLGQMEAIRSIQPATSLFISGITILDAQGREESFPENFVIHVGHSLESK
ncbi:MAG: hypothetical protein KDC44_12885, partial [Phaeodactylibacter sp.]|nr:hypothetical protein [Phaeodactylibacter sp.]